MNNVKLWRITIDSNLSFSSHYQNVCNKTSRSSSVLSKLGSYVPQPILRKLYQTMIYPHLNYGIEIWGNLNWNFIPNALHTQLMKRCYGFCFNWIVFYLILRQMQCIPNLWIAVLDFNHSGGFMMFLLTIWSTHT